MKCEHCEYETQDGEAVHIEPETRWTCPRCGCYNILTDIWSKVSDGSFEKKLDDELLEIGTMLLNKNRKYGDSALNPSRIFSKSSPEEQIRVRIDDKLSRIKNQQDDEDEDVIKDLIGYLILLRIARKD